MGLSDLLKKMWSSKKANEADESGPLACVHCGKTDDDYLAMKRHQVYDVKAGVRYVQCHDCIQELTAEMGRPSDRKLLKRIRGYPMLRVKRGSIPDKLRRHRQL